MAWCGVAGRLVALSQWGFTALFAVEAALKVSLLPLVDLQRARMIFDLLTILAMLLAEVLLETLDHAGAHWRTTVRVVLSFNDLPSALATLFILLVVNDWNVVVSGYVAVWSIKARSSLPSSTCLAS